MSRWHRTEFDMLPERAFQPRGKGQSMTLEGGLFGGGNSGGSAPPPTPQEYKDAAAAQARYMDKITGITEEMAPLQKEQLRWGLETAKTAYDQSQDDRTWMLDRRGMLSGLQDTAVDDARDFNSADFREKYATNAMEDVGRGLQTSRGQTERYLASRGVGAANPNSGAYLSAIAGDNALAGSMATAQAGNMAREAARLEGLRLNDRASNMLAGYPAMGMQATGMGAGYGASGIGLANSGLSGLTAGYGQAANIAGNMASTAGSIYGTQSSYTAAMNKSKADNDPFNTILGAGTGALMSWGLGPAGGVIGGPSNFSTLFKTK